MTFLVMGCMVLVRLDRWVRASLVRILRTKVRKRMWCPVVTGVVLAIRLTSTDPFCLMLFYRHRFCGLGSLAVVALLFRTWFS